MGPAVGRRRLLAWVAGVEVEVLGVEPVDARGGELPVGVLDEGLLVDPQAAGIGPALKRLPRAAPEKPLEAELEAVALELKKLLAGLAPRLEPELAALGPKNPAVEVALGRPIAAGT